jgi:hypothetical protein
LLKLDPIPEDEREAVGQLCLQRGPVAAQFAPRQRGDFERRLVDVQLAVLRRRPSDQRANPAGDIAGSSAVPDDPAKGLPDLLQIGRLGAEPAPCCIGVGEGGAIG